MAAASTLYVDRLGWSVFPISATSKAPLVRWTPYQARRPTAYELDLWARTFPQANIAVVTGPVSRLLVLDADGAEGVNEAKSLGLPKTPMVATPRGGLHAYFACEEAFANAAKRGDSKSIDVRSQSGYVLAPHSKRVDGKRYEWIEKPTVPLARAPAWLLKMLTKPMTMEPRRIKASTAQVQPLLARLSPRLQELVLAQPLQKGEDRSGRDLVVMKGLLCEGLSEDEIKLIYDSCSIGEAKYAERGDGYFTTTLAYARALVRVVKIKYADLNEYAGGGKRLQLCLVDEEDGRVIRCGLTVPNFEGSELGKRWQHFFNAAGVTAIPRLIGQRLRVEVRRGEGNPIVAFYRI